MLDVRSDYHRGATIGRIRASDVIRPISGILPYENGLKLRLVGKSDANV